MVGKRSQLIHDFNAAIYYFFMENKSISEHIKILVPKIIGRTEKWARRLKNQTIFNKMNFLKFKLLLEIRIIKI